MRLATPGALAATVPRGGRPLLCRRTAYLLSSTIGASTACPTPTAELTASAQRGASAVVASTTSPKAAGTLLDTGWQPGCRGCSPQTTFHVPYSRLPHP
jgi:hypothetical protein